MSNKVCIAANGITKSYECKTTHNSSPYVKVNGQYLDLTTNTTSGLQLKVKYNDKIYRPVQTYTTLAGGNGIKTEITGYSGVSTRSSAYTETVGYNGSLSKTSQYTATTKWSGYKPTIVSSTFSTNNTYPTGYSSSTLSNGVISVYNNTMGSITISTIEYLYNSLITTSNYRATLSSQSSSIVGTTASAGTNTNLGYYNSLTLTVTSRNNTLRNFSPSSVTFRSTTVGAIITAYAGNTLATFRVSCATNSLLLSFPPGTIGTQMVKNLQTFHGANFYLRVLSVASARTVRQTRTSYISSSGTNIYSSVGYYYSSSHYTVTSTKQSNYSTSSTAIGNMSSTTAITGTNSRASSYNVTSTNSINISNVTTLTQTVSYNSQYTTTTEI